ncbi:sulfatase [Cerasicoccus frondis]|uniref:sulfatase n=1 Tax=Cerasicoccus frondis TaxID=490090 RepID=UPI002852AEA9|nr:sulfatase [Cerasicoccus frondis]
MNDARPNIILVFMDDLGWRDLGCYGSTFYETPRLDAFAQEGVRFTDAYASSPVCSPSRASILTGRYPARVGVTQYIGGFSEGKLCDVPYFQCLPHSERTIASILKDVGYQTWHVGKWHLGGNRTAPETHGFDVNLGGGEKGHPYKGYFSPYELPNLEDGPAGEYLTDRLTDEAIRLIESAQADDAAPFFLNFWHYAVHTPIESPPELVEKYQAKAKAMGLDQVDALEPGEAFPCSHKKNQRVMRRRIQSDPDYAAMIENMDTNFGRLLDALERTGQAENTIIVYTSDNGGLATAEGSPTSNAPLAEGKGWMYEGGTREPLMVRWPGKIAAGQCTQEPVTSPDVFCTLLDAAGVEPEHRAPIDGASFMPLLQGEAFERGPIFWHYPHYSNQGGTPGCSMRHGDYKLIEFFEDGNLELYNLRSDIAEEHNLADAQPETVQQMKAALDTWKTEIEALIPKRNPNWEAR